MYNYNKIYKLGFLEGTKKAIEDKKSKKQTKFKNINELDIVSKIYDIGFIDGYNRNRKYIFKIK